MNQNVYAEYVDVATSKVQVFAMQLDGDKLVWSIGSKTDGIGIEVGDSTAQAVKSLKQMRKAIDGAVKFMNVKQKEINDAKGKNNDAAEK